jgi:hypothetical protein
MSLFTKEGMRLKILRTAILTALFLFAFFIPVFAATDLTYIGICTFRSGDKDYHLEAASTPVVNSYSGQEQQYWRMYQKNNGLYEIVPAGDPTKRLTASNSGVVLAKAGNNLKSQEWNLAPVGGYNFLLQVSDTRLVLGGSNATQPGSAAGLLSYPSGEPSKDMIWTQTFFTVPVGVTPSASPQSSVVKSGATVTLKADQGSRIFYTLDGSNPLFSATAIQYEKPIAITRALTLKAVTMDWGYEASSVLTQTYTMAQPTARPTATPAAKTAAPVSNTASGAVEAGASITLTCSTSGSTIYYTVDGSNPTSKSQTYTQPIRVNADVTIKAAAIAPGYSVSDLSTWAYEIAEDRVPFGPVVTGTPPPEVTVVEIKMTVGKLPYTRNGASELFDVPPYLDPHSGRTMVPIRFIAEGLGAKVEWNAASMTDTITLNGKSLSVVVNQPLPNDMGTAVIVNDRLFVPIRYISEGLGAKVEWDAPTQTVLIKNA